MMRVYRQYKVNKIIGHLKNDIREHKKAMRDDEHLIRNIKKNYKKM